MRQPRVKKEPEPRQRASPESEPGSPHIVPSSSSSSSSSVAHPVTPTLNLPSSREQSWDDPESCPVSSNTTLLTVTTPTNLLTVPQPSYLVKQHSHPLLPSQQPPTSGSYWIQRQHSNPEYPGRTTSPKMSDTIPVIKIEEGGNQHQEAKSSVPARDIASSNSSNIGLRIIPAELLRSSSTPQASSSSSGGGGGGSGSGAPETRTLMREGSNDQRLGHCPVQRPGPALGCNHCWNTIDTHGRILRRKTKYHCPECQINLCIVPCFQEFHERPREISTLRPLPKTSSI